MTVHQIDRVIRPRSPDSTTAVLFAHIGGPVSAYVEYIVHLAGCRPPHRLEVEPRERLLMHDVRVAPRISPSENPQI